MYDRNVRAAALELLDTGVSLNCASKQLGISRAALREWKVCVEPIGGRSVGAPRPGELDGSPLPLGRMPDHHHDGEQRYRRGEPL